MKIITVIAWLKFINGADPMAVAMVSLSMHDTHVYNAIILCISLSKH